jgi:hypothetical protein
MDNLIYYIQYIILYILGQSFSMWGQYYTLKFKNISYIKAFFLAIPFAWIAWFFLTTTIILSTKYNLFTPTQNIFVLTIIQFILIIIINKFYLKQVIKKSDFIAFILICFAIYTNMNKTINKFIQSYKNKLQPNYKPITNKLQTNYK